MNRITFRLLGSILFLSGIFIWIKPVYYSSRFGTTFDFSGIKWPFGGGLFIIGAFFLWSSFRKKTIEEEKKAKDDKKVLMCPKCIKPFYKKDCQDLICPECQAPLEGLSGFYERHPELKDKKPNRNARK